MRKQDEMAAENAVNYLKNREKKVNKKSTGQ